MIRKQKQKHKKSLLHPRQARELPRQMKPRRKYSAENKFFNRGKDNFFDRAENKLFNRGKKRFYILKQYLY